MVNPLTTLVKENNRNHVVYRPHRHSISIVQRECAQSGKADKTRVKSVKKNLKQRMYLFKTVLLTFFLLIYETKTIYGIFCSLHKTGSKCETRVDDHNKTDKILCKGAFKSFHENNMVIVGKKFNAITLCQLPGPGFDPTIISPVEQLHKFSLIKSNITHFTRDFPPIKHLQILNITRLKLEKLSLNIFGNLKEIRTIDLSFNRLKFFDAYFVESNHHLQHIYLRGNNWKCDLRLIWTLDKKNGSFANKVVDLPEMECGNENYLQKPVVKVVRYLKTLEGECPISAGGRCNCSLETVVWSPKSKYLVPIITVDCSFRGLKTLMESVPRNTTSLKLGDNKIEDLSPLTTKPVYWTVSDIYLNENYIRSVDVLEGTEWIERFRVLSLRDNKIKTLPTYAFDNAFQKNRNALEVYLGNNPWICDCHFTPGFKELLLKYSALIKDSNDIRCAEQEDDPNSKKLIRDLSLSSICREPNDLLLSPVDIINIVLSFMIVFIIVKLIYDYWIYKTTGHLPWIATKLP